MKKIRILIVSDVPWDDSNSFGSSFTNIFGGNDNYEIANIYLYSGLPNTHVANRFFQITEKSMLHRLIKRGYPSGRIVENCDEVKNMDSKTVQKLKILRWQIFFWARDLVWCSGLWKSKDLDKFIDDFAPNLVFQPVYFQPYINRIGIYASKRVNVPIIGYTSDDNYTLKQYSWSPLFWIDRLIKRRQFKKVVDQCRMLYVITEKQRREYDTYFGKGKCKVLYKGADFSNGIALKDSSDDIVKFVYTGNIGAGRWKILAEIANQLRQINQHKLRAQLFIYTGTSISEKMRRSLDIPGCSSLMGSVPSNIIPKIQSEADVLVYTEPFEKQFRYKARLSFSTKIVDYLASSRCILAVGWRGCGGIDYLIKNDAAQVVTDISELGTKVQQLIESEQLRNQIAMRAYDCGKHNHQIEKIHEELYSDIVSVINNDK